MSAILYDARGNEIRVGFPDSITNEVITDARPITAVLSAAQAEVLIDLNGASNVSFDVRTAAGALTFVFEGTIDGVNYSQLPAFVDSQLIVAAISAEVYVSSVVSTAAMSGIYNIEVSGYRRIRLRVSAYTSGNITVAARATNSPYIQIGKHIPSTLHVTVTAAVNTGATITLPGVAGLFHYITNIHLVRCAAAAVAGGGAAQLITTTNLPGSPVWSHGDAMAAGTTAIDLDYSPTTPLKSLLAGTATTIVMPVPGLTILNRGNCTYYLGA